MFYSCATVTVQAHRSQVLATSELARSLNHSKTTTFTDLCQLLVLLQGFLDGSNGSQAFQKRGLGEVPSRVHRVVDLELPSDAARVDLDEGRGKSFAAVRCLAVELVGLELEPPLDPVGGHVQELKVENEASKANDSLN